MKFGYLLTRRSQSKHTSKARRAIAFARTRLLDIRRPKNHTPHVNIFGYLVALTSSLCWPGQSGASGPSSNLKHTRSQAYHRRPYDMHSLRQSLRPKHQVLILKCYPRFQKSAIEVKPNSSELSYLLYYASTRRSKLQKVGDFLVEKTKKDISRGKAKYVEFIHLTSRL